MKNCCPCIFIVSTDILVSNDLITFKLPPKHDYKVSIWSISLPPSLKCQLCNYSFALVFRPVSTRQIPYLFQFKFLSQRCSFRAKTKPIHYREIEPSEKIPFKSSAMCFVVEAMNLGCGFARPGLVLLFLSLDKEICSKPFLCIQVYNIGYP